MHTLTSLLLETEMASQVYSRTPPQEKPKSDPTMSLSDLEDGLDDQKSEYALNEINRVKMRFNVLMKVGGKTASTIEDDMRKTLGIESDFSNMSGDDHMQMKEGFQTSISLMPTSPEVQTKEFKITSLLLEMHRNASYLIDDHSGKCSDMDECDDKMKKRRRGPVKTGVATAPAKMTTAMESLMKEYQ